MNTNITKILTICVICAVTMMSIGMSMAEEEITRCNSTIDVMSMPVESEGRTLYYGDYNVTITWSIGGGLGYENADEKRRLGGSHCHVLTIPRDYDRGNFAIGKIGVYTQSYGMPNHARVQIRQGSSSSLGTSVVYSATMGCHEIATTTPGWHYIDIPDVVIYDHVEAYIEIYTGSTRDDGVFIGLDGRGDNSGGYAHVASLADTMYHLYESESYWGLDQTQSDVNWMIQVYESTSTDCDCTDEYNAGYDAGCSDGYANGYEEGLADCNCGDGSHIIGDVNNDGEVNIGDAVLLFNWVSFPNERETTYVLG